MYRYRWIHCDKSQFSASEQQSCSRVSVAPRGVSASTQRPLMAVYVSNHLCNAFVATGCTQHWHAAGDYRAKSICVFYQGVDCTCPRVLCACVFVPLLWSSMVLSWVASGPHLAIATVLADFCATGDPTPAHALQVKLSLSSDCFRICVDALILQGPMASSV
jgi:hypothetical protein